MIEQNGVWKVDASVHLSQWDRGDAFGSESECERQKAKIAAIAESRKNWIGPSGSAEAAQERYAMLTNLRCIATDDPRLKGN